MRLINLRTVDNSYQAMFIKNILTNEGIECIVTNENFTALMPHLNGLLGSGIQILVDKDNFERATQLLEKEDNRDVQVCPNCSSTNIKYGLGTKHRSKKLVALFIALIIGSTMRHIQQTYYCKDCKTEFGK